MWVVIQAKFKTQLVGVTTYNFTMKEDNTTGSFCLCHLLHILSMIIKSGAIYTSVQLYTTIICTDGMAVYIWPYILLAVAFAIDCWLYVC